MSLVSVAAGKRYLPMDFVLNKYKAPTEGTVLWPSFYFWLNERNDCSDPCILKYVEDESEDCDLEFQLCTYEGVSKYRTMDGSCNNLGRPQWGKAKICERRFLAHNYADGISSPSKSCLGEDLPPSRKVSNIVHRESQMINSPFTLHFMNWGQSVAHDVCLSSNPEFPVQGPGSCCYPNAKVDEECLAENLTEEEDFYFYYNISCLPAARTDECKRCSDGVRRAANQNTAFYDLSIIYGSSEDRSRALRSGYDGMLKTQENPITGSLPPSVWKIDICRSKDVIHQCFDSGDIRINLHLGMTSNHLTLLRHHNNLATGLKIVNPHWDDDRIYQEARRINVAQAQMITFSAYLQYVLGPDITEYYKLDVLPGLSYSHYEPERNPGIWDEFAAAAMRFGHSLIPNFFFQSSQQTSYAHYLNLSEYYNWPFEFHEGQYDRITTGMSFQACRGRDSLISDAARNFLYFRKDGSYFDGIDISTLGISRAKEHGIPSYTSYLKYFYDVDVRCFSDLKTYIPKADVENMKKVYKSVHDVPLYNGVLSEYSVEGASVGLAAAAILINQFYHLKYGDRYYFEHENQAGSFTPEQLNEIKTKTTLAAIICETTKISIIQPDVFLLPAPDNPLVSCDTLPVLDLKFWHEP